MLDRNLISKDKFKQIYEQTLKTSKLINGLIRNVKFQITKEH
jgi:hypothetical protein